MTPEEKGEPIEVMLVIVGTWCVLIVFMIVAFAIAHYSMSWSYVVYDLCSSSEGSFFYTVRIKVGALQKELMDGAKYMTLDLLGTTGQFVTRLVIPFNEAIRNKAKAEKQESVTVTFKVARKRRLPDVGRIRVDHELWGQPVFVHYVDIKSLNDEEGPRHFRANINSACTMLNPAEVDVTKYQRDQVFPTEHDINYPDGRPVVHPAITLPEGTVFFLFSAVLVLCLSCCIPKWMNDKVQDNQFRYAAINGAVSGLIGVVVGLLLLLLYKMLLKRQRTTCGLPMTGRFMLMTLLLIIAIGVTIAAGILAYNHAVVAVTWTIALLVGVCVLLVVGVPIGALIENMSRKRANSQMVQEESTVQQTPAASRPHPLNP